MKKTVSICILTMGILSASAAFADQGDLLNEGTFGGGVVGGQATNSGGGAGNYNSVGGSIELAHPFAGGGMSFGDARADVSVVRKNNNSVSANTNSYVDWALSDQDSGLHFGAHHAVTATDGTLLVNPASAGFAARAESGKAMGGIYADPWSFIQMRDSGISGNFGGVHADALFKLGDSVAVILNGTAGATYGLHRSIATVNSRGGAAGCQVGGGNDAGSQSTTSSQSCSEVSSLTTTEVSPGVSSGTGVYYGLRAGLEFKLGQTSGMRARLEAVCDNQNANVKYTHLVTGDEAGTNPVSAKSCGVEASAYMAF